ncbi:MAG TPA: C-terminal binding protein [Phototrophicaceae bacterium]|nr:C-terminal binding protein [Phototrophicaceae bacterium]
MAFKVVIPYHHYPDLSTETRILQPIGAEIIHTADLESPESVAAVRSADALMVSTERVSAELMDQMERCKIICRLGTGYDAIDVPAATARGIWVTYVPDYSIDEVSTHAISLLLTHNRRLPRLFEMVKSGIWWQRSEIDAIVRLSDLTYGVLGHGRIGMASARKGRGLGMRVIACDPYIDARRMTENGVTPVDFATLLRESDYLSLHVPLNDETRQIINDDALAQMKSSAILINTARGACVNIDDLLAAVQTGTIAGALLDVLPSEPPAPDHPIMHEPRIWITPHAAWYSEQSTDEVRVKGSQDVVRVLKGEMPRTPVNQVKQ